MRANFGRYPPLIGVLCGILSPCALGSALLVPSEYPTIQAGIDAAVAGDTVLVADGTYTGAGNKDLDFHGKAITVRSASGNPVACVIDCQGSGRGFYFHTSETGASVVAGFTIRNGKASSGGAVYCSSSSPTLTNCTITGNTVSSTGPGGGVYCTGSSPTIVNCTISANTAYDAGGVDCTYSSSPTLTNCTITGNSATYYGGGVKCAASCNPTLTNCTISGNTAGYEGGGVWCYNASSPVLTNCAISGNTASPGRSAAHGGGMFCSNHSNPMLIDCTISDNTTSSSQSWGEGGGVYCDYYSSPMLTNCTLRANTVSATDPSSSACGGAVYCYSSTPTLTNCTISGNTATSSGNSDSQGAGLYCNSSDVTLTSCTISGNAANSGAGAMFIGGSALTFTNSTINGNRATAFGAGLMCVSCNPTLTNCTISENTTDYSGGGVECANGASPTLTNCTISRNTAFSGAGLDCNSASPTLANCTISGNIATVGGGVCCIYSSSPTLINCTIKGNTATYEGGGGGGVFCSTSSATLTNCVISGNTGVWGGAVDCDAASPTLTNCTIYGNSATYGGGVNCWPNSSPMLTNCILWANTPQEFYLNSSTPVVTYCDVQGGYTGTHNLNLDPLFVNASSGNFRLTALSPCIDAGTNTPTGGLPDYDADGNPRVLDGNVDGQAVVDMGAYELYRIGACYFAGDGSCHYLMPFDCAAAGGAYQGDGTPCEASNPNPADGAVEVAIGVDLAWDGAEGATSYDVYFGTVSPPPLAVNVTSTGWWLPTLAYQTTYYWQVVARRASGRTPGPIWSFTTQSTLPSSPANPSPWDGAANVPIAADLDWADAPYATSYDVYFGTVSPPPLAGDTTTSAWALPPLAYQTTYYWQVVAWNATGSTPGPVWSFTTLLRGDLNCDGRITFDDINPFVLDLTAQGEYIRRYPDCSYLNADINGDGYANFGDINPFVECLVLGGCP